MNCIEAMQTAIDFMEQHLYDDVTYADTASYVYMSAFHFHRLFSIFCGFTPTEYLRNRRLSIAGQELAAGKIKVIDAALKYGYETPESFTRAFTRFHGVNPAQAGKSNVALKLFNRLILKITFEGGSFMDYRIETREAFSIFAWCKDFFNETNLDSHGESIPQFCQGLSQTNVHSVLHSYALTGSAPAETYGICSPKAKGSDTFLYGIGKLCAPGTIPAKDVPAYEQGKEVGYTRIDVPGGTWAVFPCFGTGGECMMAVWEKIIKEFLPSSSYVMRDAADFEVYPFDGAAAAVKAGRTDGVPLFSEIWVPVEKAK